MIGDNQPTMSTDAFLTLKRELESYPRLAGYYLIKMIDITDLRGSNRSAEQIAEAAFQDANGVPVSITLSVDTIGDLFEMDVFKADFSPLIRYPDLADLAIIERDERGNVVSAG